MRYTGIWHRKIIWKRASQSRRFPVCFQSVERTIYCRMERCGLRALNFSNISDDELDRNVTEAAKDVLFCGEQMSSQRKRHQGSVTKTDFRPQTPKLQAPRIFFPKNIYIANRRLNSYHVMFYGHVMFKGNSQKEAKYLSSPVYRCCIDQTVKI